MRCVSWPENSKLVYTTCTLPKRHTSFSVCKLINYYTMWVQISLWQVPAAFFCEIYRNYLNIAKRLLPTNNSIFQMSRSGLHSTAAESKAVTVQFHSNGRQSWGSAHSPNNQTPPTQPTESCFHTPGTRVCVLQSNTWYQQTRKCCFSYKSVKERPGQGDATQKGGFREGGEKGVKCWWLFSTFASWGRSARPQYVSPEVLYLKRKNKGFISHHATC